MKNIVSILSLCLVFVSCTSTPEVVTEEVSVRFLNEVLIMKNDGKRYFEGKPFTGVAFDVYDNGELWKEYNYKDGQLVSESNYKDGELRFRQSYHDNGQMRSKKNLKNFRSDGLTQRWYDNGQLEMEENWKGGEVVSFKHWDKNGKLSNKTNYIDAYSEPMD
ncbi:hypothetical protein N9O99_02155 [Schleiferiaceae bacterium]|nr:hypothetical protein [Schleiferiaceae bacterium]